MDDRSVREEMAAGGRVYRKDPGVVARVIAGEAILVPVRQNTGDMEYIYTLNETAARAWELIDGQNSLEAVCDQIVSEYEIDPQDALADLQELIDQLAAIGALQEA